MSEFETPAGPTAAASTSAANLDPKEVFANHGNLSMQLTTLRVPELQSICRAAATWGGGYLSHTGKKAQLVSRIDEAANALFMRRTEADIANYRTFKEMLISRLKLANSGYRYAYAQNAYDGAQNPQVLGAAPTTSSAPSNYEELLTRLAAGSGTAPGAAYPVNKAPHHVPAYMKQHSTATTKSHQPPKPGPSGSSAAKPAPATQAVSFHLKPSPFFNIRKYLGQAVRCPKGPYERKMVRTEFTLAQEEIDGLSGANPTHQLRLVCTPWENHVACSATHPATVEFPPNGDVRVNGQALQANLRGPKKHPGRVTPPDLGPKIMTRLGVKNWVEFSYSGSLKEYVCAVSYVEKVEIETLVKQLDDKVLSKGDVIKSLKKKAEDDDIVSGAATVGLKCPLSLRKLDKPSRSKKCDHLQCFDPTSFLRSNEQAPNWSCPVCSTTIRWEDVVIDGFVRDILSQVGKDVESVIVEPDGSWKLPGGASRGDSTPTTTKEVRSRDSAITLEKSTSEKQKEKSASIEVFSIDDFSPPQNKRVSALNGARNSAGSSSRLTSEEGVIDLTFDSDDDDDDDDDDYRGSPHLPSHPRAPAAIKRKASDLSSETSKAQKRVRPAESSSTNGSSHSQRLADGSEVSPNTLDRFFGGEE